MRLSNVRKPSPTLKGKSVTNFSYKIQTPTATGISINNPNSKSLPQPNYKQPLLIPVSHKNQNPKSERLADYIANPDNNKNESSPNELKSSHSKRRRTLQPQANPFNRPNPLEKETKDNSTFASYGYDNDHSGIPIPLKKNELSSSLTNLAQVNINVKKKESGEIKIPVNLPNSTPQVLISGKYNIQGQSRSFSKFRTLHYKIPAKPVTSKPPINIKSESTIKILIMSNWGHENTISCSEIDILGTNHFPIEVSKVYVEPLNHTSTRIAKLINRDMIKNEEKDIWVAKWPPTPPLQKISLIFKVHSSSNDVDSMRFWPTTINPTSNIKSVEIYINNDPVFKGDLPKDFGQVISLKPPGPDSDSEFNSDYEYEYKDFEDDKKSSGLSIGGDFKVDVSYSNNKKSEISQQIAKRRVKRRKGKGSSQESDLSKARKDNEKLRMKQMKSDLNKIRSTKIKLSQQIKGDEFGLFPNPPIQNIEIRCFDSYESNEFFSYSWIRIFDSNGLPIDVRSSASIVERNCGGDCLSPCLLFHEDERKEEGRRIDLWKGRFQKSDAPNAASGDVLVHFTDLTLVSAIVLYTFRHPKGSNLQDFSAKRVRIYIEERRIWAGRLKHSIVPENDPEAREDDCATVIFLTAEPEVQDSVFANCFPSIYSEFKK